jgi:hypothetical protein
MTEPPLEPLVGLREQFRAAAARQIELERRTRRPRRGALIAIAAVVATGGIAAGTQLISTGKPAKEPAGKTGRYRPANLGTIAVTAADPAFPVPWGVLTYRTGRGETCALAGQVRGNELGAMKDGAFHPYEARSGGACGDIERHAYFGGVGYLNGRTLLYGRARADVARMRLSEQGEPPRSAAVGPGGAYLFVLKGRVPAGRFRLTPLDERGAGVR